MTPMHDDDPRLTQHLLEGLRGEDLEALAQWIDEPARRELEQRAQLIDHARQAFEAEAPPAMSEAQQNAILQTAREHSQRRAWLRARRGPMAAVGLVSAAAALLVVVNRRDGRDLLSESRPPPVAAPAAEPSEPPSPTLEQLQANPYPGAAPPAAAPAQRELPSRMGGAAVTSPAAGSQFDDPMLGIGGSGGAPRSPHHLMAQPPASLAALRAAPRNTHDDHGENDFVDVEAQPRSTFGIDVDSGSYSLVRRYLESGRRPPVSAVRIEELLNAFHYDDPAPASKDDPPVRVRAEAGPAPWSPGHVLVRIGLRAREVPVDARPPANLVFLIDTSGSMAAHDRLPWVKRGLLTLAEQLTARDRLSIVTYASGAQVRLASTPGNRVQTIVAAIEALEAGGSTNGGEGLQLAYAQAERHLVKGGINRVVLASDGDFNVGITSRSELEGFVTERARRGIALSVLGYGMGSYRDSRLEQLADHGDGNYAYIDGAEEAERVLVRNVTGTLHTVAKDVKLQVELNPARVQSYRLIGYENRALATRDFTDDAKDAGEMGAGASVTALYELVPQPGPGEPGWIKPSRYQAASAGAGDEWLTVSLRYKRPEGGASRGFEVPVKREANVRASDDFRFAASVALFGMLLRGSPHAGEGDVGLVQKLARQGRGRDPHHERRDFASLVQRYADLPPYAMAAQGMRPATLDAKQLTSVVRRHRPELQRCYESIPPHQVTTDALRLDVSVTVDASGVVTRATSRGVGPVGLHRCVEYEVRSWRFPVAGRPTQFAFPVLFQP